MKKKPPSRKYKIKLASENKTVTVREDALMAEVIREAGIPLSLYCGMKGLCGKCLVEITRGQRPALSAREKLFIRRKKLSSHHRLACLFRIKSDLTVKIPESSKIQSIPVLQTGIESVVHPDPSVKKYEIRLRKPRKGYPLSPTEALEDHFQRKLKIPLPVLKELPGILGKSRYQVTVALYDDEDVLSVEPGRTASENIGAAIDLGTTTVVVELVDLNTGQSLGTEVSENPQIRFGSDVMSRIGYAVKDSRSLTRLREPLLKTLNGMIEKILERRKLDRSSVYEVVVAGNSPMNHILLGLPVEGLAVSPFQALFSSLPSLPAEEVGLRIHGQGKLYVSPNIKSFVGGDISAGLAVSDFSQERGSFLYLDLGTNGEIVLKTEEGIWATSTAAGPAFEGMNTSCGMMAVPGAIDKAEYKNGLIVSTIGNKRPAGVCGTGFIDLLAVFLESGQLTSSGRIKNKSKRLHVAHDIYLTQRDVRELQLATAAVKSGTRMVLANNKLRINDLDGVFVAGAFGHYLNIQSSIRIGLLPAVDEDKVRFIGNASLAGAKALLLSRERREKTESMVKNIQYVSLAANPRFQEYFLEAMEFKETKDSV